MPLLDVMPFVLCETLYQTIISVDCADLLSMSSTGRRFDYPRARIETYLQGTLRLDGSNDLAMQYLRIQDLAGRVARYKTDVRDMVKMAGYSTDEELRIPNTLEEVREKMASFTDELEDLYWALPSESRTRSMLLSSSTWYMVLTHIYSTNPPNATIYRSQHLVITINHSNPSPKSNTFMYPSHNQSHPRGLPLLRNPVIPRTLPVHFTGRVHPLLHPRVVPAHHGHLLNLRPLFLPSPTP